MSYRRDEVLYDPEDDIWLPIYDYPGYYISNTGHVWGPGSLGQFPHELSSYANDKYGHQVVDLYRNGKRTHRYVHQLVAEAFIPNRYRYPEVCHIDGDPLNNDVSNLRWGTHLDNMRDAQKHRTFHYFTDEENEMCMEALRTPIKAIDIKSGKEFEFISQAEAARVLNLYQPNINHVLSGRYKQTGGYRFEYIDKEAT